MKKLIAIVTFSLLLFSANGYASVIYDYIDENEEVLGTLFLNETIASHGHGWGPSQAYTTLVDDFLWFDDTSGIYTGTGIQGTGRVIPGAVYSSTGQSITTGRIGIDTVDYHIGSYGSSPLAYDIFSTIVARRDADGNREIWFGTWEARAEMLSVSEPLSLSLLFVGLFGVVVRKRKV